MLKFTGAIGGDTILTFFTPHNPFDFTVIASICV
jgi:hypothetical protein